MALSTLDYLSTTIATIQHDADTLERGDKRRRICRDQIKMWETFTYTDKIGRGFTLTKTVKNHRVSAFERFADILMAKLSDMITHWEREGDTITFHAVALPPDNTVWCKPDNRWYMPQKHSIFR